MIDAFTEFCSERESVRQRKEAGKSHLTDDPILQEYSFCNINREHDAVTVWIEKHVRRFLHEVPIQHAVAAVFTARIFNEPETLRHINFSEYDIDAWYGVVRELRDSGQKILRGAYLTCSKQKGVDVVEFHYAIAKEIEKIDETVFGESLESIFNALTVIKGIGDFTANQVIADFRHIGEYKSAPDWHTFVRFGPGTRRGLNRYFGLPVNRNHSVTVVQAYFDEVKSNLVEIAEAEYAQFIEPPFTHYFRDPNNLANAFCEFDKYMRVVDQQTGKTNKTTTLRKYRQ